MDVRYCSPGVGVFAGCRSAFSFSLENIGRGGTDGVIGSTFLRGACLLPGIISLVVFSGELYIPKTSSKASFVLIVTVGSAPPMILRRPKYLRRDGLCPSSLKSISPTEDVDDVDAGEKCLVSEAGGGPHFFPRRPIERALASCILYSPLSSVNNKDMLNRSFSGRLPGGGGANINAYRVAAVELNVVVLTRVVEPEAEGEEVDPVFEADLGLDEPGLEEDVDGTLEDVDPLLKNS